jgi:uncharacterized protein YceK
MKKQGRTSTVGFLKVNSSRGENMRKALIILALLAVTSGCATSNVMDCATATAYATLQCGGAMLTGGDGACAHACADAALFCGEAVADIDLPEKSEDCHTDMECYQQCLKEGNNEQDC